MSRPKELRKQLKDQVREKLSQEEEDFEKMCDAVLQRRSKMDRRRRIFVFRKKSEDKDSLEF